MATCTTQKDGDWSDAAVWDTVPADGDAVVLAHVIALNTDISGLALSFTLNAGARLYVPATAEDTLCASLAAAIHDLAIDDKPVYAGFGNTAGRGLAYWQVVPTGGAGVPWKTGDLRDGTFQLNRVAPLDLQDEALASAEALLAAVNEKTGWTAGNFRIEVCEALGEPMLRSGVLPGTIIAGFNVRVMARKV